MALGATSPAPLRTRPYRTDDRDAVLALIGDDRLTGQPEANPAMLAQALAGHSPDGTDHWTALEVPRTVVAHDTTGRLRGVISWATRPSDHAGFILWLHAGEDPAVASALIDAALDDLGPRTVHAFAVASALSLSPGGLPVRSRPATRKALESAGFCGHDRYRYFHRHLPQLPAVPEPRAYPIADVRATDDPTGWHLRLRDTDGALVGQASFGAPVDGIGLVRWIHIDAEHRGRGLGRNLLAQGCDLLAGNGGHELIAYLDEDPPHEARLNRTAANLLATHDFDDIDTLRTFTRRP